MKWCVVATGPIRSEVIGPFDNAQQAASFASEKLTKPVWATTMVACPLLSPDRFKADGPFPDSSKVNLFDQYPEKHDQDTTELPP
jgi:hypothetical protein